jgi:RND family efflux transporter MFP subunit
LSGTAVAADIDTLAAKASCLVDANQVVKLSSSVQGAIAKILVKRGDHVEAGQIVALLDSDVEQAMYEAAQLRAGSDVVIQAKKSELVNAERKLERQRQLAARAVNSAQSLEDAETAAEIAKYAVEQAKLDQQLATSEAQRLKATIERRTVRSSVDGAVAKVELHEGEFADPSATLAVIAEIRPLLVEIFLPIEAYPLVKIGMQVEVRLQEPIGGRAVSSILTKDPQIDSASGTFRVTLKLANSDEAIPAGIRCSPRFLPDEAERPSLGRTERPLTGSASIPGAGPTGPSGFPR